MILILIHLQIYIFDIDNKLFQFLFDYTKNDQTQSTYIF